MSNRRKYAITGMVIAVLGILIVSLYMRYYQKLPPLGEDLVVHISEPRLLYGLKADSFHIEESRVARNQNLSDLLSERGVSAQTIDQLAKNSVAIFDVRKIKAGNRYTLFYSRDSDRRPLYLAYENNNIDYYLYP